MTLPNPQQSLLDQYVSDAKEGVAVLMDQLATAQENQAVAETPLDFTGFGELVASLPTPPAPAAPDVPVDPSVPTDPATPTESTISEV